ncbi:MAG: tRNA (adenosine(37)-N6)-dimethylallyltransferase MiaA, partial [Patescibacteria group bacterium]|nr:tRNA (adenosine(37)-N6)-dimethylallyltransferase MiaA [Patescibacteria group bacterium]
WKGYFQGTEDKKAAIEKWKLAEHQYAKRQLTWFKKDKKINWFNIFDANFGKKIFTLVSNWYNK